MYLTAVLFQIRIFTGDISVPVVLHYVGSRIISVKRQKDDNYYRVLEEDARKVPAGSDGVLFLPYLTGGINDIPDAVGCFLNMTMDTDQATLWHAVLEAIGYDYMEITDLYRSAGID